MTGHSLPITQEGEQLVLDFNQPIDTLHLQQEVIKEYKFDRRQDRLLLLGAAALSEGANSWDIIPDETNTWILLGAVSFYLIHNRRNKKQRNQRLLEVRANQHEKDENKIIRMPNVRVGIEKTDENFEFFAELKEMTVQLQTQGTAMKHDILYATNHATTVGLEHNESEARGLLQTLLLNKYGPMDPRLIERKIDTILQEADPVFDYSESVELEQYKKNRRLRVAYANIENLLAECTQEDPQLLLFDTETTLRSLSGVPGVLKNSYHDLATICHCLTQEQEGDSDKSQLLSSDRSLISSLLRIYQRAAHAGDKA